MTCSSLSLMNFTSTTNIFILVMSLNLNSPDLCLKLEATLIGYHATDYFRTVTMGILRSLSYR